MIVLLLLILVPAGVLWADTIYTWYYGKQLASFLEAVNSYISSAGFADLWKIVVGFSFIFLLFAVIASAGDYRQTIRLLKFYVIAVVAWYLLVLIKVPVDVEDKCTKTSYTNIEAPWAIAKPLSWLTRIEGGVRDGLVFFFGIFLPEAYKENEGCFTGYELLRPAVTYQPKDPYLRLSIESYIKDCIIPTVLAGDIDRFSLVNSNDLWNNEFACGTGKLCAALTTVYFSPTNPEGVVDGCPNVYARISADIVNEYTRAWRDIKVKVFGSASAIAETDIPVYLGEVTPFLMSVALTGENLIRQAITIQSLNQVSAEFATAIAYQEAYLNALARLNMLDFGRGGTLNAMKGVIETILAGLTPIFFLLFLTPIGGRIFYGWITAFVWLVLWSVAEVITVSFLFLSIGDNQKFDFTLAQIDRINLAFNKAAQISSLMSDYIPLLTLFLATGSIYAMTHFATGMSRELRDEHGTKVMSSGNLDVGNVRARGYSDLTAALAASSVGTVNWGTANAGTWAGDELRVGNTTIGTDTQYTFSKPMSIGGTSGVATGYKTDQGLFVTNFMGNNGVRLQNVLVGNDGKIQAIGKDAYISARDGKTLMQFLSRLNPSLTAAINEYLYRHNLNENELRAVSFNPTEGGFRLNFITTRGGQFSALVGEKGSTSTVEAGGVRAGTVNGHVITVSGLPRKLDEQELLQKIGQRRQEVQKAIQEFHEKTRGWSESSRATYSAAIRAYSKGEISAEELEKTWQTLKEVEDSYRVGIGGSGGTFKQDKDPRQIGPQGILRRLPAKLQKVLPGYMPGISTYLRRKGGAEADINWGGRERRTAGSGGKVGSSYTMGTSGDTTDAFSRDFSRVISENLRHAESELKSLGHVYSELQSRGLSFSKDIVPVLIDRYAHENGLSVDEALAKLSQNNWKELDNMIDRFIKDSDFRNDVLKEAQKKTEIAKKAKDLNIDTSSLKDVRGNVEEELKDKKEKVEEGVKNVKGFAGAGIANVESKGESIEGSVEDSLSDRKLLTDVLAGMFFASSLLGLFPHRIPRIPGTGPKGLPGGSKPPLPGGKNPPEGELPPEKGSFLQLEGINKPEQLQEYARKYGIELTNEEAQRMLKLRDELIKTTDPSKQRKIFQEMENIAKKAANRNPEAFARLQKEMGEVAPRVEKAIVKQVGEEGAKAVFKKIPLLGLAMGAYFAYQRAQEGDTKGAILELASGIASTIPGVGTLASIGIDGYLLARDMGIVDDKVSREEFNETFNKALLQARNLSGEGLREQIWNNNNVREQVLETMRTDPNFYLNYQGRAVRLDENGNIYDYSALAQKGLSVNTEGQIYDVNTGRIVRNVNRDEFVVGRIG